ncbi:hypothetical protein HGO34_22495 [Agrobacterium vitis]|uniref:5 n=1 Tax=Agrobacterium vitis TaxID=373 RepID=P94209_AGRVI|nr:MULTISPECIES: RolB family protein [Rhizobium/Agrobacterium group]AAB41873.1 5 (plasmid) [Agrobacterium vitis]MCM2442481.1 hypothetical protein [Agrobacterium vitis]NOJ37517.1 hypothetical protein [Agrobacterium vitis]NSZ50775.1 hypothetical protein [Agrobacterium vitis]UJL76016.1 hypothetical protein AVCG412_23490 [Agrobacterium vitis]
MDHSRPIFNVIDCSHIQDRRELEIVLLATRRAYLRFAQQDLIPAQRSWIDSIIDTNVPIDPAIDEVVKRFRSVACLPAPVGMSLNIVLNDSLMYVYCSFQEMRRYACERFYEGFSGKGVVISTVPPYSQGITKEAMRCWQNEVCHITNNEKNDLDAYIAFLPNTSLQNTSFSHVKIGGDAFLAPSRADPFCVEIVAVGKALFQDNGLKKAPKAGWSMALTSLLKRLV